jgi:hypothetical protein
VMARGLRRRGGATRGGPVRLVRTETGGFEEQPE